MDRPPLKYNLILLMVDATPSITDLKHLVSTYTHFILDVDGVLINNPVPIPQAASGFKYI